MPIDRKALTLAETAAAIGVPERTLQDQVAKGLFPVPFRRVGRRRFFSVKDLDAWLAGEQVAS